jgi:UDP-glucose 4-epimerase
MKSKYLVCGAGGFIGGHLVKSLLSDGHEVICADVKPLENWFQIFDSNKNFSLDLKEYENCLKVSKDADFIYNIYMASNKLIVIKPYGLYYSKKNNDIYTINAIMIDQYINIPIIETTISNSEIIAFAKKYKIRELLTESKSVFLKLYQILFFLI